MDAKETDHGTSEQTQKTAATILCVLLPVRPLVHSAITTVTERMIVKKPNTTHTHSGMSTGVAMQTPGDSLRLHLRRHSRAQPARRADQRKSAHEAEVDREADEQAELVVGGGDGGRVEVDRAGDGARDAHLEAHVKSRRITLAPCGSARRA